MANAAPKIDGYRELTADEVKTINALKGIEAHINSHIDLLGHTEADQRALAIAATHIETGFMFLIKSIARPARLTDAKMDELTAAAVASANDDGA